MKRTSQFAVIVLLILTLTSCGIIPDIIPGRLPDRRNKEWGGEYVYTTKPLKLYYDDDCPGYNRRVTGAELGGVRYDIIKKGSLVYIHGMYRKQGTGIPGGALYAVCTYKGIKYPHSFGSALYDFKMPWRLAEKNH